MDKIHPIIQRLLPSPQFVLAILDLTFNADTVFTVHRLSRVDSVNAIFHCRLLSVSEWSCQPLQVYYTKDSPKSQGCGGTQKDSTRKSAAFQPCSTSGHGVQRPAGINPFRSIIDKCLRRICHAPRHRGASQAAGGSGCHSSAGLRSSPASPWEGVSKFHCPPRCRRARLAGAGSKACVNRSTRFCHLLKRAVLAARLSSLITRVLCLEYCIFSCPQKAY